MELLANSSVSSCQREMDALNIVREKKDMIELLLTNAHRTYGNGDGIINHIEKQFKLQIVLMCPDVDDMINAPRCGGKGVTIYFMKSVTVNELNKLWATAMAREKSKRELSTGKLSCVENEGNKRTRENDEQNGNVEKKPRVIWTKEMHQKFLEAIAELGHDKAPKKIVELVNFPGVTRENVASHLQKYRMYMKRAQEGFTDSSYDFTNPFTFNTSQRSFQQSYWNPFQTRFRNTTTSHFNLNNYNMRPKMTQHESLLNTIRFKPDHNFRVYGDERKNVPLSINEGRVRSNNGFAGFRLTGDGKSVMFGEKCHLGIRSVNESCIPSPTASSLNQRFSYPELGNDDSSYCLSSVVSPGTGLGEPVRFSGQMSSLAALLGVDEPISAIFNQLQPSAASPGFDWNKAASFTSQQSTIMTQMKPSEGYQVTECNDAASFTCQQPTIMTQMKLSEGYQVTECNDAASFTCQQPTIMTHLQPSEGYQVTECNDAASFTCQQPTILTHLQPCEGYQVTECNDAASFTCQQPTIMTHLQPSEGYQVTECNDAASFTCQQPTIVTHLQPSEGYQVTECNDAASFTCQQPTIMTHLQPSEGYQVTECNDAASFTCQQPTIMTHLQPSEGYQVTECNDAASFTCQQPTIMTRLQPSEGYQVTECNDAASFTCQQPTIMTQMQPSEVQQVTECNDAASFTHPQSAGLQGIYWAEPPIFSPQETKLMPVPRFLVTSHQHVFLPNSMNQEW